MILRVKRAVAIIAVASCLTGTTKAMSIHDFGKMSRDDEATYIALLIEGSSQMLKARGHPDQALKTLAFFKEPGKDGGVQQLADHLKMVDALNKRNAINPNNRAPVYQVEDAMELTLKNAGIIIPARDLLTINKGFRPTVPPVPL